jgi:hypothetical protein
MYYNRTKENNNNNNKGEIIMKICTQCANPTNKPEIINKEVVCQECSEKLNMKKLNENGCEMQSNRKYTSKEELVKFFETFRNKETKLLRVIAYFSKDNDYAEINDIAEFDTIESDIAQGIFTKSGIKAWVKHLITDMIDYGCWIEVEIVEPN